MEEQNQVARKLENESAVLLKIIVFCQLEKRRR